MSTDKPSSAMSIFSELPAHCASANHTALWSEYHPSTVLECASAQIFRINTVVMVVLLESDNFCYFFSWKINVLQTKANTYTKAGKGHIFFLKTWGSKIISCRHRRQDTLFFQDNVLCPQDISCYNR